MMEKHICRIISKFVVPLALLAMPTLLQAAPVPGPLRFQPPAVKRPNIILIMADDLGYGDLGCYGQKQIKTPSLDKLAAEGMRFTQAYAGSTVCAPSRCALMTGLHTGHARIRGNAKVPLEPDDVTIANLLRKSGYQTGLIGKWGLGDHNTSGAPWRQGFEQFLGYIDQVKAHNYYPEKLWRFDPVNDFEGEMEFPENAEGQKGLYSHDLFSRAALSFIRINKPNIGNQFAPFFLFLSYTIPHANNEEGARSGSGMEVPSLDPYAAERWPDPEKGKAAMITRMDAHIGAILDALKEAKIDETTVIFFTSDNGPHKEGGVDPKFFRSSGHLRGHKRDLYEGGIRVPMIARWPGAVKPGKVSDEPWALWDFMATVSDIASITNVPPNDGISILPTLLGKAQTNRHDAFYWEFHERGFQQAVRMRDWKGISRMDQPFELYNLTADPGETNNVAGVSSNKTTMTAIKKFLASARTPSSHWVPAAKAKHTLKQDK